MVNSSNDGSRGARHDHGAWLRRSAAFLLAVAALGGCADGERQGGAFVGTKRTADRFRTSIPDTAESRLTEAGSRFERSRAECLSGDIAVRLGCLAGVTVTETTSDRTPEGYRQFSLVFDQPVDHSDPASPRFSQRTQLLHRDATAPMVLATSGYGLSGGRTELMRTFSTNQLQVEHRYFLASRPEPTPWEHLNIRQAAADFHAITGALQSIYTAPWVNTGASKGGMTSVYHRRFYPNDVAGTVAYVAPMLFGTDDGRFVEFVDSVGGAAYAACRAKLYDLQRIVLQRREAMEARMTGSFTRLGSKGVALEHAVLEAPFAFWQYGNPDNPSDGCDAVPTAGASDDSIFAYFENITDLGNYADGGFEYFSPYYYQAATELGAPAVRDAHIASELEHRATYSVDRYGPPGVPMAFSDAAMRDVSDWVASEGRGLLFIYGEYDPWSAGMFELGQSVDSHRFVAPAANHGAQLRSLTEADRRAATAVVRRWMGLPATDEAAFGSVELRSRPRTGQDATEDGPEENDSFRRPRL
jgi:hypothetical protein